MARSKYALLTTNPSPQQRTNPTPTPPTQTTNTTQKTTNTHTPTKTYTKTTAPTVSKQRKRKVPHSAIIARIALPHEFVSFLKEHLPIAATSLVSTFGARMTLPTSEL
ncbi:ABC transporter six-transmembrane domain-containing protein [Neisseria sp. P0021.S002]|uniref:ABC transporter six-transmembrane domain-containing protein n=1 Tax=Neisseria sp. P0021.S002 TaxID=3436817 RepID=UPI003F7DFAFF